jgi:hypothetical protein
VPQAMVTGTPGGTDSVKDAGSAKTARTVSRASKKARASAAACRGGILAGLATNEPSIIVLPSALRASAGISGRATGPVSCAARKTAMT